MFRNGYSSSLRVRYKSTFSKKSLSEFEFPDALICEGNPSVLFRIKSHPFMHQISKSQARRLAVSASIGTALREKGRPATLSTVKRLGYLQIDTISVIERAHHHILSSRQKDYAPEFLNELLAKDKTVFEYWAHAASYMPMEDYRFFLPKMDAYKQAPTAKWQKERLASAKPLFKKILKRISKEGPLGSKDFEHVKNKGSEGWWNWKPAKAALDLLYLRGELMVTARRNFQRIYDLSERVLPEGLDTRKPEPEECAAYQIKRALRASGIARETEISRYIQACDRKVLKTVLNEQAKSGELIEVAVKGIEGEVYYAFADTLDTFKKRKSSKRVVRIMSPFDNLVIQRDRMSLLFDFDYTIECYVPEPKRKYGYFVCPILWGDELVARIDMKADRKTKTLIVKNLHYEIVLKNKKGFEAALTEALETFAEFNGCDSIITK